MRLFGRYVSFSVEGHFKDYPFAKPSPVAWFGILPCECDSCRTDEDAEFLRAFWLMTTDKAQREGA